MPKEREPVEIEVLIAGSDTDRIYVKEYEDAPRGSWLPLRLIKVVSQSKTNKKIVTLRMPTWLAIESSLV